MNNKILIVDDDIDIAEAMEMILSDVGYEVIVNREDDILGTINKEKPKLVILDVLMSGVDGRDICAAIKNDPLLRSTAVVMISAHPMVLKSVEKFGANYFLSKPFESDDLVRIVGKYVE